MESHPSARDEAEARNAAARRRAFAQSKWAGRPFNPDLRISHCRIFTRSPYEGHMMSNRRVW